MSTEPYPFKASAQKKIFSFGEILWDQFPSYRIPGGSPLNVAAHLYYFGHLTKLVSSIGQDQNGRELIHWIQDIGLSTDYISENELPTGHVMIRLTDDDEPSYSIEEDVAWDFIGIQDQLYQDILTADAFVFASLAQRSEMNVETLKKLINRLPSKSSVIFDCNLRPPFIDDEKLKLSIEWSDIVKCNEEEWEFIQELFDLTPLELVAEANLEALLITQGERGARVITADGSEIYQSAYAIPKSDHKGDFVGVGDAFLAAVTALYLQDLEWRKILKIASEYAAWVASQRGGTPKPSEDILTSLLR